MNEPIYRFRSLHGLDRIADRLRLVRTKAVNERRDETSHGWHRAPTKLCGACQLRQPKCADSIGVERNRSARNRLEGKRPVVALSDFI